MVKKGKVKDGIQYYKVLYGFFDELRKSLVQGNEVVMPGKGNGSILLVRRSSSMQGLIHSKKFDKNFNTEKMIKGVIRPIHRKFNFDSRFNFVHHRKNKKSVKAKLISKVSREIIDLVNTMNEDIIKTLPDLR
jgi:hypothetical protein